MTEIQPFDEREYYRYQRGLGWVRLSDPSVVVSHYSGHNERNTYREVITNWCKNAPCNAHVASHWSYRMAEDAPRVFVITAWRVIEAVEDHGTTAKQATHVIGYELAEYPSSEPRTSDPVGKLVEVALQVVPSRR